MDKERIIDSSKTQGRYDERNKLNDLTGREWLLSTKSFFISTRCADDKAAFAHPAPFLIKDIERLISVFTKKGMIVLDPFLGSGTTAIAAYNLNRKCIGIDLSEDYQKLAFDRFTSKGMHYGKDYTYLLGDAFVELDKINEIDYIITSPPYHNILKNDAKGIREDKSKKGFRNGSRTGIEFYSNKLNDLGNQISYDAFLELFGRIMQKAYIKLKSNKYCSIIISDLTIDKQEVCVQSDIVNNMQKIGFKFVGTIILLQDNKPLYPFGYPYKFKINHMHQNIINFIKE